MISDTLFEAVCEIEEYEKLCPGAYFPSADKLRKVKLEMRLVEMHFEIPPPIAEQYTAADYDWVRGEAMKRAESKPPHQFSEVIDDCISELAWKKKDVWEAAARLAAKEKKKLTETKAEK